MYRLHIQRKRSLVPLIGAVSEFSKENHRSVPLAEQYPSSKRRISPNEKDCNSLAIRHFCIQRNISSFISIAFVLSKYGYLTYHNHSIDWLVGLLSCFQKSSICNYATMMISMKCFQRFQTGNGLLSQWKSWLCVFFIRMRRPTLIH